MSRSSCHPPSASRCSWGALAERRSRVPPSTMPNGGEPVPSFRERYGALPQRLAGQSAAGELDALKTEIGTLFKQLEQEIGELSTLRDDVKQLVERWKTLRAQHGGNGNSGVHATVVPPSNAPQFTG